MEKSIQESWPHTNTEKGFQNPEKGKINTRVLAKEYLSHSNTAEEFPRVEVSGKLKKLQVMIESDPHSIESDPCSSIPVAFPRVGEFEIEKNGVGTTGPRPELQES
jgi:hypothetical protein